MLQGMTDRNNKSGIVKLARKPWNSRQIVVAFRDITVTSP